MSARSGSLSALFLISSTLGYSVSVGVLTHSYTAVGPRHSWQIAVILLNKATERRASSTIVYDTEVRAVEQPES